MEDLDFGEALTAPGAERAELLQQAATALDRLGGQLGPGGTLVASPEGDLARAFTEDKATVERPQVFPSRRRAARSSAARGAGRRRRAAAEVEVLLARSAGLALVEAGVGLQPPRGEGGVGCGRGRRHVRPAS